MSIELIPTREEHIPELARICFEAFGSLHRRHQVPLDFEALQVAELVIGMVVRRPDFFGVAARLDGRLVGSNFMQLSDSVAGVGPITVDPAVQARGIGKALMQRVIDEAANRNVQQVRLFQEAVNTTSLPLYTSLGFIWRDSAAIMQAAPAPADDPTIRPAVPADLPAIQSLSQTTYGFSRANDAAMLLRAGPPGFVRVRQNKTIAYFFPSLFGHGGAQTDDDLIALATHAARHVEPPLARFLCPLSQGRLFRRFLDAGCRVVKVMSYMSLQQYTPPPGSCLPSIAC